AVRIRRIDVEQRVSAVVLTDDGRRVSMLDDDAGKTLDKFGDRLRPVDPVLRRRGSAAVAVRAEACRPCVVDTITTEAHEGTNDSAARALDGIRHALVTEFEFLARERRQFERRFEPPSCLA